MTMNKKKKHQCIVVWMRRALRVQDHTAFYSALQDAEVVIPVLCLSDEKRYKNDTPRRRFVRSAIASLDAELQSLGSQLVICRGDAEIELPRIVRLFNAECVYAVRVYDSAALTRDKQLRLQLKNDDRDFVVFKDSVLFEMEEILNQSGLPFKVYTPYRRVWLERANEAAPILPPVSSLRIPKLDRKYALSSMREFDDADTQNGESAARKRLYEFTKRKASVYKECRDFPAIDGTSNLSAFLSLGVVSIRQIFWAAHEARLGADRKGRENIDTFIGELIWREFYYQILANFPFVTERSFKNDFSDLQWSTNRQHFAAWCEGRTGYPIVDAGMRQLLHEGWMHNRVRMMVASFLTKDLHINWRWGEEFFLEHLCDADIASNNGGWQWSAGTGTDAQPWFRIFNPISQGKKFDADGNYVRKYVPELAAVPNKYIHAPWLMEKTEQISCGVTIGKQYPHPIVDHAKEREVTMQLYKREPVVAKKKKRAQRQLSMF